MIIKKGIAISVVTGLLVCGTVLAPTFADKGGKPAGDSKGFGQEMRLQDKDQKEIKDAQCIQDAQCLQDVKRIQDVKRLQDGSCDTKTPPATAAAVKMISAEKAKEVATAAFKAKYPNVTYLVKEIERENKGKVYEIEFLAAGKKYEVKVNAITGKVLYVKEENAKKAKSQKPAVKPAVKPEKPAVKPEVKPAVSAAEAKLAALAKVEGTVLSVVRDSDDSYFEIEILSKADGKKYEVKVDYTGKVLSVELED